jgi:hypothetical protein
LKQIFPYHISGIVVIFYGAIIDVSVKTGSMSILSVQVELWSVR